MENKQCPKKHRIVFILEDEQIEHVNRIIRDRHLGGKGTSAAIRMIISEHKAGYNRQLAGN